jgi:N-acetylneuraminic acid mutarotase
MVPRHSPRALWSSAICAIATCISVTACGGANSAVSQPNAQGSLTEHRSGAASDLRSNTSNTWTTGQAMPTARGYAGVAAIGSKIYVLGGYGAAGVLNTNQVYDTVANTWTTLAPMPTARWTVTAAAVNGIVYAIGGDTGLNGFQTVVEAYDPVTNTWTTKSPMPTARNSVSSTVLNNVIYVIGGYNGTRLATVEAYDPSTDSWATKASLLLAKSYANVGTAATTIIAAGGLPNSGMTTRDNETYKPLTNTWHKKALTPGPKQASCNAGIGADFYVASGVANTHAVIYVAKYTVATNIWTPLATIPKKVSGAGGATVNGLLYCMGGADTGFMGAGHYYNYVQIYQP